MKEYSKMSHSELKKSKTRYSACPEDKSHQDWYDEK